VIGVVGGLIAAVCWTLAGLCASFSGRAVGPMVALAWVNVVTLPTVLVAALLVEGTPHPSGTDIAWTVVYGIAIPLALWCAFEAMTIGPVGLVAPVISTEGAMAAIGGVILGESIAGVTGAALALTVIGIVLSALEVGDDGLQAVRGADRRAMAIAMVGAVLFGITLIASSRTGGFGPLWTITIGRGIGVVLFSVPVLVRHAWARPTGVWALIVANGLLDLVGFSAYIVASHHGIAIPAILASQYAMLTAVIGYLFMRERLGRIQWVGVALTVLGTGVVAATAG
jgi:drug/metabolite transporter (DMT)-like permease